MKMSTFGNSKSLSFSRYFPNHLEFDPRKVYNAEVFPSISGSKMRSKSIQVSLDLQKETVRQPNLAVQKQEGINIPPQVEETEPPPVPSITSSPQPPNEPSPQNSMTDAFQTWENIRKTGEPRIVISLIGSYNEFIPSYKWKHQLLLKKALTHVARYAGRCGFLYKEHDIAIAENIIRNSCSFQCLPQHTYGYTSTVATDISSSSQGKVTANETDYKLVMMKLLEIENYINAEARVAFEDGTLRKRNVINPLRDKTYMSDKEIRVPVVLFVLNGGLDTLEHVIRAIYTNISVVVVKGTGGTADLIALCLKDMTKVKRKLPVMFAKRFSDDMYAKIEEILNQIVKRNWMVSIFNVKKNNKKELWEKLTDGILRAWSFEGKKDESYLTTDLMNLGQIDFISKYVAEIDNLSKKELFGGYDIQTRFKSPVDLQHTFVNAFLSKRTDIIQQILSSKEPFALSKEQFTTLCQEVVKSQTSKPSNDKNGYKLLEIVHPEAVSYLKNGKGKGFKDTQQAIKSISNKLLQGLCFSKLGLVTCCKNFMKTGEEAFFRLPEQISVIELLRVAIMSNNVELAGELWSHCDNPMLTALVSNVYLTAIAHKAEQLFEETLQADILSHSRKFSSRAVKLLDSMFRENETMATKALDCVSEVWDHKESPLHFGHQFSMEDFISHASAQKDASKRMYPYVNEKYTTETMNFLKEENFPKKPKSREFLPYIKDHLRLDSAFTLFTAPVIKLFLHVPLESKLNKDIMCVSVTALVSNVYLTAIAHKAEQLFEETLQADILSHSRKFSSRAVKLLDSMFRENETMATKALDCVSEVWDHKESPLHFGHQFSMEDFISHASAQKDASKRMYPYVNEKYTTETMNFLKEENFPKKPKSREFLPYIKDHLRLDSAFTLFTAPVIKLFLHVVFFVTALVMLSYVLTRDLQVKISILEGMLFFYIVGDLLEELWSMIRPEDCSWSFQRILLHLFDLWNILDLGCFILYIVGFTLHYYNPDLLMHTRRIYSVALFLMFLRLLNLLLLTKRFGIIIIMMKEMLVDLFEYLVILIILMFAAGIVYNANIYPNHTVTAFPRDIQNWQIWSILKIPYWQVYGELYLDFLEAADDTGCTTNSTLWQNDPSVNRCPTSDWLPPVIAATYMMLTNWLLLNIVIAMFSSRFESIKQKSSQKWRYHRHAVVIEYEHKIPSPLNIPFRVLIILFYVMCYLPFYLCDACAEEHNRDIDTHKMLQQQREFARAIIEKEKDGEIV